MEERIFPDPAVAGILHQHYVEARLHTDGAAKDAVRKLQTEMTSSVATPFYVLLDPATGRELARYEGATYDPETFAAFLRSVMS